MRYIVRYYDSLVTIASRFGVSIDAIKHANGLRHDFVYPGQVLLIPIKVQHHHHLPVRPSYQGLAPFGLHPYYD